MRDGTGNPPASTPCTCSSDDDLSYRVEYREGGPDRHFQAWAPRGHGAFGPEPVARVVRDRALGRPGWREALAWVPWPPGSPAPAITPRPDAPGPSGPDRVRDMTGSGTPSAVTGDVHRV